jgi:hypothetical protein
MTPKEKAAELIDSFYQTTPNECFVNEPIGIAGRYKAWNQSKQCALIAVDEILKAVDNPDEKYLMKHIVEYWSQVKQEIENL